MLLRIFNYPEEDKVMFSKEFKAKANENTWSRANLLGEIQEYVDHLDGLEELAAGYADYKVRVLEHTDIKWNVFHYDIMDAVKKSDLQAMKLVMKIVVKNHVELKGRYLDKDAIAMQIGKKLAPKTYRHGGEVFSFDAYHKLSLGLNIIEFLKVIRVVNTHTMKNAEKHNIVTVELHSDLVDSLKDLRRLAYDRRAGMPMLVEPTEHGSEIAGGYLTEGLTMLKGSTVNHTELQEGRCLESINKQQGVAYKVKEYLPMFEDYKAEDKWFDHLGMFMDSEFGKLVADIKYVEGKEFYAPLAFDFRGRQYDRLAYMKIQGDKFSKAYYELASKEVLTADGVKYLKIAIVNEVYDDKISFEDALAWFDARTGAELVELADGNPIALTLLKDYSIAMSGTAVGTITHWDATNSGMQWYSVLGRDELGAALCNVIQTSEIADAYKVLADKLNELTETTAFSRSNVKKAFMVYLYGSLQDNILNKIEDPKNGVRHGIGEFFCDTLSDDAKWDLFETAMEAIAPAAVQLMKVIYSYVDARVDLLEWTMPDGFKVSYSPTKTVKVKGNYIDLHSKTTREGSIDTKVVEGSSYDRSLAPNIIHSIDAYFLREVVLRCPFEVSTIHDSFGCHPNNTAKLMEVVREVTAEILEEDLLVGILDQINARLTSRFLTKGKFTQGKLTTKDILESKYIVR